MNYSEDELYERYKDFEKKDLEAHFSQACISGDIEKIKFLLTSDKLKKNINIHFDDDHGFIMACENGQLETVKYLLTSPDLKEHADIHACLDWGLSMACRSGNLEIVKYLLTSPDLKDHAHIHADDDQALFQAFLDGHLHVIKYLLTSPDLKDHATIYPNDHLRAATSKGYIHILDFLFNSPELKENLSPHQSNDIVFNTACKKQNLEVLNYLIFDLNIDISPYIEYYFNDEQSDFADKVKNLFEMRELNKSLSEDLSSNQNIKPKTKL